MYSMTIHWVPSKFAYVVANLEEAIENLLPLMGDEFPNGKLVLDAKEILDNYEEPFAKLFEIFEPISRERDLEIYAHEHRDQETIIDYGDKKPFTTWKPPPDQYIVQWRSKSEVTHD